MPHAKGVSRAKHGLSDLGPNETAEDRYLMRVLQAFRDYYSATGQTIVDERTKEREAIVEWLRSGDACCVVNADRIERCEHLKERT